MSEYLKIVFQNIEPVRISDDSANQSGQTMTLRYIPGTALRGIVVNSLAQSEAAEDFEKIKKLLFSDKVRYMNSYLTDKDEELFPSPKGFYENKEETKGKKAVENVIIDGSFTEGNKRASLGRFCRMEGNSVYYYNVFSQGFILGNGRSAGLGKCRVISCEYTDELPYKKYIPKEGQAGECYMMLLSNTVMRGENGEFCGLDIKKLGEKMEVSDLEIKFCSTSTVDVKGYNRTWRARTPSVVMYEQGSMFHLKYTGTLTAEKMLSICDEGIGVRRNEGFGRVLFLDGYEGIKYKEKHQFDIGTSDVAAEGNYPEDNDTLHVVAGCYYRNMLARKLGEYVVNNPLSKGNVANSQLGAVEAYATAYKYDPKNAEQLIREYLDHAFDKEDKSNVQKDRNSISVLKVCVKEVFDTDLETLLCVSTM